MNSEEIKNKIRDFLKNHELTVISTIDNENNKPESAVIAFAENENLELIFGTSNTTRKYHNLKKNPHVSFVIGWDPKVGTVQYEGMTKELAENEKGNYAAVLLQKNPRSQKFADNKDQRYFLVTPTWIRILDMTKSPDEMFEITL
jgi:uncharacterized pyridoxamine 5'-phosphate oxidase family protein